MGEHAVAVADPQPDWPCVVVGAGPIGLAILLALKARRTGPIVVADLAPARRALALELGADAVVDPRETPGYVDFAAFGVPTDPLARQAALAVGEDPRRAVLFEAVGVPGVIQGLIAAAPPASRIVVAGVCMETDRFEPGHAVGKELELRFAFGYTGAEFSATLERIAADPAPGAALISDRVALLDLARTFRSLADGDPEQVKVLVVHEA